MLLLLKKFKAGRSSIVFTGFLVLLPILIFYAVGARSIEPINGQDGYAYIGIVARTQDFLDRFPDSYFGTRFGYVLPSVLFHRLFGFEIGHHLLRFLFLGCVALLMRIRGQIRQSTVVIMVILFCFSPIVLVSTFSTYTMSLGALFLLLGLLIFSIYDSKEISNLLVAALSSASLAMAWNSHLQLLLPSMVIFGVLIVDRSREQETGQILYFIKLGIAGVIGAAMTCALGSVILGTRYGLWNPWAPSLSFTSSPVNDAFQSRGFDWITWSHYVLLVPLSIVVGGAVWLTEENKILRRVIRRMTLSSLGLFIVYVIYQWMMRNILFQIYFHSSGIMICCTATLVVSLGVLLQRDQMHNWVKFSLIPSAGCAYVLGARYGAEFRVLLLVTFLASAIFLLAITRRKSLTGITLVALIALSSWMTVSSPHDFPSTPGGYRTDPLYDLALFSYDKNSMNRGSILNQISLELPSRSMESGDIKIWFDPIGKYDQFAGPFLWYRSALQAPTDFGPPEISEFSKKMIDTKYPRFIVVLDENEKKVKSGSAVIRAEWNYDLLWFKSYSRSGLSVFVALLESANS